MKKLLSTVSIIALSTQGVMAQQPTPANLGISYTIPNIVQVLDSTNTWVPMGTITNHFFTPTAPPVAGISPGSTIISPSVNRSFLVDNSGVLSETFGALKNAVNVISYGADPSGNNDSTAAINSALSVPNTCTYIPTGTYKVTNAIILPVHNYCVSGDGRTASVLEVTAGSFNLAAQGVVVIPSGSGDNGGTLRDFGIAFSQPDVNSRSSLVQFPPGIYMHGSSRAVFTNLEIDQALTCIDAGNASAVANTGGFHFDTINCGSLNYGLTLDGGLDGAHVYGWHSWPFGLSASTVPGLNSIYLDGKNECWNIGRIDGIAFTNSQCFRANIHLTADNANSADATTISDVDMDSSQLIVDNTSSTGAMISNINWARGASDPANYPAMIINGGTLRLTNFRTAGNAGDTIPGVQINSGNVSMVNGVVAGGGPNYPYISITGGSLSIIGSQISPNSAATVPYIQQTGGGLRFIGNRVASSPTGAGVLISYGLDSSTNLYSSFNNAMLGWTVTTPANTTLGVYGSPCLSSTDPHSLQINPTGECDIGNTPYGNGATLIGYGVGAAISNAPQTTLVGNSAGASLTTGSATVAFGTNACNGVTTSSNNTCVGAAAGKTGVGGTSTAIGGQALLNTTGANNTALGYAAGASITTGVHNIVLGMGASLSGVLTTGNSNILIGGYNNCDAPNSSTSNYFALCAISGSTPLLTGTLNPGAPSGMTFNVNGTFGLTQATWADNQTCTVGQISVDANYIYVCTTTNTVKRVALSAF